MIFGPVMRRLRKERGIIWRDDELFAGSEQWYFDDEGLTDEALTHLEQIAEDLRKGRKK